MKKLKSTLMMLAIASTTTAIAIESKPTYAANLSFTGNLNDANDIASFLFTADGTSTVNIRSYSYAGGTNINGLTIASGGFDPILTLFDASDNFYLEQEDIGGGNLDFQLSQVLPAGNYRAVISAFANFANQPTFADGFSNTGDFFGRTSAYAFDIQGVNNTPTAVPEPASLIGTALAGFAAIGLKRKLSASRQDRAKNLHRS